MHDGYPRTGGEMYGREGYIFLGIGRVGPFIENIHAQFGEMCSGMEIHCLG
jgi:hypothetical protein